MATNMAQPNDWWPAMHFGPVNLWALPAAWKGENFASAVSGNSKPTPTPTKVNPRVSALMRNR